MQNPLLFFSIIIFFALLIGIFLGVMVAANFAELQKKAKDDNPKPRKKKKIEKETLKENPAVKRSVADIKAPSPVMMRALNDDESQTEFECDNDGEDLNERIREQRKHTAQSYNILSSRLAESSHNAKSSSA